MQLPLQVVVVFKFVYNIQTVSFRVKFWSGGRPPLELLHKPLSVPVPFEKTR